MSNFNKSMSVYILLYLYWALEDESQHQCSVAWKQSACGCHSVQTECNV